MNDRRRSIRDYHWFRDRPISSVTKTALGVLALSLAIVLDLVGEGVSKAQECADRGIQLAQAGDLQKAEVELRLAVQLSSNNARYWSTLGSILSMQRRFAEANLCFDKALKI